MIGRLRWKAGERKGTRTVQFYTKNQRGLFCSSCFASQKLKAPKPSGFNLSKATVFQGGNALNQVNCKTLNIPTTSLPHAASAASKLVTRTLFPNSQYPVNNRSLVLVLQPWSLLPKKNKTCLGQLHWSLKVPKSWNLRQQWPSKKERKMWWLTGHNAKEKTSLQELW